MLKSLCFSLTIIQNIPDLSFQCPHNFPAKPLHSSLSSNQRGTHLTIHVESLMGKRRDLARVPSTINATQRILLKMTRYRPIFNPALQGIFNNYLQICIMNEERECILSLWHFIPQLSVLMHERWKDVSEIFGMFMETLIFLCMKKRNKMVKLAGFKSL